MNASIKMHLEGAKLAIATLQEALHANNGTDGELRLALSEVTDAYCELVDTYCHAPVIGATGYSAHYEMWNQLGGTNHYSYLRTATRKARP